MPAQGYWMLSSDGTVYPFGTSGTLGSATNIGSTSAIASTPDGLGYWVAGANGSVDALGEAASYPSSSPVAAGSSVVTIESTPDGKGYWLASDQGQVITAGDASDFGSPLEQGLHLTGPIVNMVVSPDGKGYWLLGSDGGVFTYGDASFFGSTGNLRLNALAVAMSPTADGRGYWFVASDGGLFSFGDASFYGSIGQLNPALPPGGSNSIASHLAQPVNGMLVTSDGAGYWMVASDGGIFAFGDAGFVGSLGGQPITAPIVGIARGPLLPAGNRPVSVTLGAPQAAILPSLNYTPDAKYYTYQCSGSQYGIVSGGWSLNSSGTADYTGEDHVFILSSPMSIGQKLTSSEATTGLEPGAPGTFDFNGIWVHGVYQSPDGILHGYYHAEIPYPPAAGPTYPHKSLAYAESTDCGKTWTKLGYPNNQIITGSTAVSGSQAGDASLYEIGDYLYLFYAENGVQAVARSLVSDAGKPGTWFKWYCSASGACGFSQPGIGGMATSINPGGTQPNSSGRFYNTFISYNSYLGEYISIDNVLTNSKIDIKVSTDAINWAPLGPSVQMQSPSSGDVYWYGSILGLNGSSVATGRSFWIYYTEEGATVNTVPRTLYRVEVTLQY